MNAGLFTQPDQEPDVVNRDQSQSKHVFNHEQVSEIPSRIRGAGLAVTGGIERGGGILECRTPDIEPACWKPGGSMASIAGGGHEPGVVGADVAATLLREGGEWLLAG